MNNSQNRYFTFTSGKLIDLERIIIVGVPIKPKGVWAIKVHGEESFMVIEDRDTDYGDRPALVEALLKWGEISK